MAWDEVVPERNGDVGETDKKPKAVKMPLCFGGFDAGAEIATRLVKDVRPDLSHCKIQYICRNIAKKKSKRPVPGAIYKVNPMYRYLTGFDFIVEVALEVWNEYNPNQRVALIDHLLMRIETKDDDESGDIKYGLRAPEIQEFAEVYARHQAWNSDLVNFESHMKD